MLQIATELLRIGQVSADWWVLLSTLFQAFTAQCDCSPWICSSSNLPASIQTGRGLFRPSLNACTDVPQLHFDSFTLFHLIKLLYDNKVPWTYYWNQNRLSNDHMWEWDMRQTEVNWPATTNKYNHLSTLAAFLLLLLLLLLRRTGRSLEGKIGEGASSIQVVPQMQGTEMAGPSAILRCQR